MHELRQGRFVIHDGGGDVDLGPVNGYTYGTTWNGFACPYFTRDVADQLVARWNSAETDTIRGTYDPATDTYHFIDTERPSWCPESYQGEPQSVDGDRVVLYPLGNGAWCWNEEKTV